MHGGSAEVVDDGPGAHIRVRLPLGSELRGPGASRAATPAEAVR